MAKKPLPQLSDEEKGKLIIDVMRYLVTVDRLWVNTKPGYFIADLIRCIVTDTYTSLYGITWVYQALKKVPELYARVGPYMGHLHE